MERSMVSDYAEIVEFQRSLLRVASPGEPPSAQAIEFEQLNREIASGESPQ